MGSSPACLCLSLSCIFGVCSCVCRYACLCVLREARGRDQGSCSVVLHHTSLRQSLTDCSISTRHSTRVMGMHLFTSSFLLSCGIQKPALMLTQPVLFYPLSCLSLQPGSWFFMLFFFLVERKPGITLFLEVALCGWLSIMGSLLPSVPLRSLRFPWWLTRSMTAHMFPFEIFQ